MTAGNGHPPLDPDLDDGADRRPDRTRWSDQSVGDRIGIIVIGIVVGVPAVVLIAAGVVWLWRGAWAVLRSAIGA